MRKMFSIFFCSLVGIMVLGTIVQANPIEITLVNYSIYQNNRPIDDSITFSVKCYGSYNEYRLKAMGLPENRSTAKTELVYSYSLSCEPNTCFREDTSSNPTWGMNISSCNIEGLYKRKTFFVNNFTTNPEPSCSIAHSLHFGGYGKYEKFFQSYAIRDEDRVSCDTKYSDDIRDTCDRYLTPDRPEAEGEHFYHESRNKTTFIATDDFVQCIGPIFTEQRMCYENHSLTNLSIMRKANPAVYCEKRIDIPSYDQILQEPANLKRNTYDPKSPVESLYCSILRFLGGRCE